MFESDNYDVIVAGGGPAGATTAALVAAAGHRVLLVERDLFPRFKIGESLMPECGSTLQRLGVKEKLQASHFPKKYSVQFFGASGKASAPFYFTETQCTEHPQTWQVVRSEFDQLLVDNAREKGVEVHFETALKDVLFEGDRAVGVEVKQGGETYRLGARVVVDATGLNSLLARRFNLREVDTKLRNASIFTHFKGGMRDAGIDEGATLVLHTRDRDAWFWYIPQPDDVVSVGVVAPVDALINPENKRPPQELFDDYLSRCEGLKPKLAQATQMAPVQVLKDFTYRSSRRGGDGWILVGDAYGFIDPLYSTGVYLALKSGEFAADAILDGLALGDLSAAQLSRFEPMFRRGMEAMRKLVHAFYDKDFSIAKFLEKYPERRDDIVQILVGNVFHDQVDDIFVPMSEMVELPTAWA